MSTVTTEGFGGLNLTDDPREIGWSAAVDLLNVDIDRRGRVRQRPGCGHWSTSDLGSNLKALANVPRSGTTPQLLAASETTVYALSSVGATISSVVAGTASNASFATIGTTSSSRAYIANYGTNIIRWDGSAFSILAGSPAASYLAVQPNDNRLAAARIAGSSLSRVQFSDAGDPETWGASNYVDLSPGDGEDIEGLVAWREMLFAFKESKMFVFYGNSTDATGSPVFNYRTVPLADGPISGRYAIAGDDGVYFLGRRGLYVTTGGPPQRIGRQMDAFFNRDTPVGWQLGGFDSARGIGYCQGRVVCLIRGASMATDVYYPFVYDVERDAWLVWDRPARSAVAAQMNYDRPYLFLGLENGYVAVVQSGIVDEGGAAISSRYRTGFADLGSPEAEKTLRELLIEGYGSVTVKCAVNDGSLDAGATVALGTSPDVAQGRHRVAYRGRNFSVSFAGTADWQINRLAANVREERPVGAKS